MLRNENTQELRCDGFFIADAAEDDLPGIMDIERKSIFPPWTHGALLGELYREDSFFAVARHHGLCCAAPVSAGYSLRSVASSPQHKLSALGFAPDLHERDAGAGSKSYIDMLGFIILRRAADEGELLQIAVDESKRRQGAADMLMNAAIGWAYNCGLKSVFLEVRKSNEAAINLYKKHSFKYVRQRKDYYCSPVEDAVVMMREI